MLASVPTVSVILLIAWLKGFIRLSDELKVIMLQWSMVLHAGPKFIMLYSDVGR